MKIFVRQMLRAPGYAAMVVLTLALAIGANSAVFSAVSAVLLQPLPVTNPENVVVAWQTDARNGQAVIELTYRHLREWTATSSPFERAAVIGSHNWDVVLEGHGPPVRVFFSGVSAGFFEVLGVEPLLGRTLTAADDVPNAAPVAVLSHGTWVRRFAADPAVVGRTMSVDGESVEIVGVMPEGFEIPRGAEFWAPVMPVLSGGAASNAATVENVMNNVGVFYLVGRVLTDAGADVVRQEIDALDARLMRDVPGRPKWGDRAVVTPLIDFVFGPVRPVLWALWAAVGVLLLVASANVSGLILTRLASCRRDEAVRLAIGATPARLGRRWLAEILALSVTGGALGLIAATWIAKAIAALAPDDLPGVQHISVDATVAWFTLAVVVITAIATSVLPLRQVARVNLVDAFGSGDRSTAGRRAVRARSTLLVGQMALSVVLLVAAGLVLRSFVNLRQIDHGFDARNVLSLTVQPRSIQGPANAWFAELADRLDRIPGVEAAGAVYLRPLQLGPIGQGVRVWLEGQPETDQAAATNPTLNYQNATPGYFEAMRIRAIRGRLFTSADTATVDRVALVSESTARQLWPAQDPIGRRLLMSTFTPGAPRAWRTVVGVVNDVRYRGIDEVQLDVYDSSLQVGLPATNIVVRTAGSPLAILPAAEQHIRSLDATALVDGVTTMERVVERATAPWRLTMWMFTLFATVTFGLALTGLLSVVGLDVAHRRQEFAIRMALGASARGILGVALGRTLSRVAAGVSVGVLLAVLATRMMRSLLFGVAPSDVVTFVIVICLVVFSAALAAYIPGRRASRADVNSLLKHF